MRKTAHGRFQDQSTERLHTKDRCTVLHTTHPNAPTPLSGLSRSSPAPAPLSLQQTDIQTQTAPGGGVWQVGGGPAEPDTVTTPVLCCTEPIRTGTAHRPGRRRRDPRVPVDAGACRRRSRWTGGFLSLRYGAKQTVCTIPHTKNTKRLVLPPNGRDNFTAKTVCCRRL